MGRRFVRALLLAAFVASSAVPALAETSGQEHLRVVFVGGLGSTATSNQLTFGPLSGALTSGAGYARDDLLTFGYAGGDTCQPLSSSAEQLAGYMRDLRDSKQADGVVLVGHSMGGVVALDAAAHLLQLTQQDAARPFVRRIITVDSPLGGLTRFQRAVIADLWLGVCPAANDAVQRYADTAWPATLSGRVRGLIEDGVQVYAVANPEDLLLDTWTQYVPEVSVNVTLSAIDDGLSHSAVLTLPHAVAELVRLVGTRAA